MNYGHGGLISAHKDTYSSAINGTNSSEHFSYGGQRILTFMMYLTNLALGGNTIFPNIGLSIKPAKGTALFWFNFNEKMQDYDKIIHMGCPVIRGNKWIANKWIKFSAQFKHYKSNQRFSILQQ